MTFFDYVQFVVFNYVSKIWLFPCCRLQIQIDNLVSNFVESSIFVNLFSQEAKKVTSLKNVM